MEMMKIKINPLKLKGSMFLVGLKMQKQSNPPVIAHLSLPRLPLGKEDEAISLHVEDPHTAFGLGMTRGIAWHHLDKEMA